MIKNIIFDLAGVILNLDLERDTRELNRVGLPDFVGCAKDPGIKDAMMPYLNGISTPKEFLKAIRPFCRPDVTDDELFWAMDAVLDEIPKSRLEMLIELRKKYKVILLSNIYTSAWEHALKQFAKAGYTPEQCFDNIFLSMDMHLAKPDSRIFQQVIDETGIIPDETVYFDDSATNVATGNALGLHSYQVEINKIESSLTEVLSIAPSLSERAGGESSSWVTCWGNATSITDRKECTYAKDITLRYPVRIVFSGSKLRFRLSNLTGTEDVHLSKAFVAKADDEHKNVSITFGGNADVIIKPGTEIDSDEIPFDISAGETVEISMYFADFTQMNAGTLITGPLSKGKYSYGDFAEDKNLPQDLTRKTNWFYFLNTIDILTDKKNHALVCYGDSITAQSWPDYLAFRCWEEGFHDVAIIRRAVSGTRILRQYDCITYQAYGLKGATRFPIEMNVSGASAVIIQHGINDIIHPVGVEVNPFRPWSDLPTVKEMTDGVERIYIEHARKLGLKVWSGTLLPILGWRTYNENREVMRNEFNQWLRTSPLFDGCVDFDRAVCDKTDPRAFAPGFDSGDHLHPSEAAYKAMAYAVPEKLFTL